MDKWSLDKFKISNDYNNPSELLKDEKVLAEIKNLENYIQFYIEKDAFERYLRLKIVHKEIALKALVQMTLMVENNKVKKICDEDLRNLLLHLNPINHKTKIIRK
jgi:DNA-binding TFAR19-related protein (PDSD5 family)